MSLGIHTWKDQVRNENIRKKSKIFGLNDGIQQNKKSWYESILRGDPRRITQQILQYNQDVGRWPLKRSRP
jgi:hypothetical protein